MNIIKGNLLDLFDSQSFDVIAHGCNCFHTMGNGIAKQIRDRYVGVYAVDVEYTNYGDINKLGGFTYCYPFIKPNEQKIYNLYTQFEFGTDKIQLNYMALSLCLFKLNVLEKGKRIGLPLIGCGLAGGDPTKVVDLIQQIIVNCDVTLVKLED